MAKGEATGASGEGRVLAAAVLIMLSLGTLYAWSLFLAPLEAALSLGRGPVSSIFGLATVSFAAALLFMPLAYRYVSASSIALLAGWLAAAGLALSALAPGGLLAVQSGYGVAFGLANGIGYGLALQVANDALPRRRGLATGIVVAAYAMGAVLFAPLARWGLGHWSVWQCFAAMAGYFAAAGVLFWLLLKGVRCAPHSGRLTHAMQATQPRRTFWLLWGLFLFGAGAGLMALGHAAGLVSAYGGSVPALALGTAVIALGNGSGRLAAGWLSDHVEPRLVLAGAGALGALSLGVLALWPGPETVYPALAGIGFAYGLIAAGVAAAVAYFYGRELVSAVFGRVFTAWGIAGLTAPVLAGLLLDAGGSYLPALYLAAGSALLAMICSLFLPTRPR